MICVFLQYYFDFTSNEQDNTSGKVNIEIGII